MRVVGASAVAATTAVAVGRGDGGGGTGGGGDGGGGSVAEWARAAAQVCQVPSVKLARGLSALRAYTIVYWRKHLKDEAQERCIDKHTDENIKLYRNELRTKLS